MSNCGCNTTIIPVITNTVTNTEAPIIWKGVWTVSTLYPINSLVSFNGSTYIATAENIGEAPDTSAHFDLFAAGGTNGTNGTNGANGSNQASGFAFNYLWLTANSASNPGAGKIKIDNSDPSAATTIYMSNTDHDTGVIGTLVSTLSAVPNIILIEIRSSTNNAQYSVYQVITTTVSSYTTFIVTYVTGTMTSSFTSLDNVTVSFEAISA